MVLLLWGRNDSEMSVKLQNPHGSTCRRRNVNMACRLPFPAKVCRIKRFVNEEGGEGILKVRNLQSICGLGTATKISLCISFFYLERLASLCEIGRWGPARIPILALRLVGPEQSNLHDMGRWNQVIGFQQNKYSVGVETSAEMGSLYYRLVFYLPFSQDQKSTK